MSSRRNTIYFLIILSLLAGLFTGRAVFFAVAYVLGMLLAAAYAWAWAAVRWIKIARRTRSRRAQVGGTLNEAFTVTNRALLPKLWLEIRDQSTLPGHRASHVTPVIGARGMYDWDVNTVCVVRGAFQLGPVTLVSGDPFGLFLSPRHINTVTRLVVYPMIAPVRQIELPVGVLSGGDAQRRRTPYVTTNAAGVRDYTPGDSLNRVHWKSSARRGKFMVKEFELDPLVDIWLFVDFSTSSLVDAPGLRRLDPLNGVPGTALPNGNALPASTEEYAVAIAASLTKFFIDSERALGFAAHIPHREIFQPERGQRQFTHIMESLAIARSQTHLTLAQMLLLETPYLTRGTTMVIITASLDRAWIAQTALIARKGIRPMCILIDPASFGAPVDISDTRAALHGAHIPTIVVRQGDDLTLALGQRPL
jgi:uncharacterized protein (DUF58 family)